MPVIRDDDGELLGYVRQEKSAYVAETIFGYPLARTERQPEAEMVLRSEGLLSLQGIWRYYDTDESDWFPCTLKDVYENRVVVIRTNEFGYQEPDRYKMVTIKSPDETKLQRV